MTIRSLALAAAIVAALAEPAAAQQPALSSIAPPARFSDPARLAKLRSALPAIDSLMQVFVTQRRVPGYAYGIVVDGQLIHVVAGGRSNLERGTRVDTASVFRIASMSKSFAALAILQLRDEGKLDLDAPAERYVPELSGLRYATSDAPRITVRHLLTHSAGFPEDNPWGDQQLDATEDAFSAMMRGGIPSRTRPAPRTSIPTTASPSSAASSAMSLAARTPHTCASAFCCRWG